MSAPPIAVRAPLARATGRLVPGGDLLILTEDSKPAQGGIAEYLHNLAVTVAPAVPVRIVSSIPGAGRVEGSQGVQYHEVPWFRAQSPMQGDDTPVLRRINTVRWLAERPARVQRLLARLLHERPTRAVLIARLSPVTHPWCRACERLDVPFVLITYGLELLEPLPLFDRRRQGRFLRAAERVFAISRETRELTRRLGVPDEKLALLLPGVSPERLVAPRSARSDQLLRQIGLPDAPFLLTVCGLRARKGVDLAVRAFAAVAREYPRLRYVVVGDGSERTALEALSRELDVGDRTRFVGEIDEETKLALFERCELFLMPNRRLRGDMEGFGMVFLEANVFGKAVIGGNNGGVPDAVEHGRTGLLVDTAFGAAPVVDALRKLLGDPDYARRLGEQGRQRALTRFQWSRVASEFVEYLRHAPHASRVA